MTWTRALLSTMVIVPAGASIAFASHRDWKHAAYWLLAAAINAVASTF